MVEQRLDFNSPLKKMIEQLAQAAKSIVPDSITTKWKLEADVEDSFNRLKGQSNAYPSPIGPMTAVDKIKSGYEEGTPEEVVAKAFRSMESAAKQVAYWQDRIDNKKGSMANALEHIEKLHDKLDSTAKKAKEAAEAIGGDMGQTLSSEISKAKRAAEGGEYEDKDHAPEPNDPAARRQRNQALFQRMMSDPGGAAKAWLKDEFFGSAIGKQMMGYGTADISALLGGDLGAGGVAAGAAGIGIGAPLAVYGGLKAGDAINMHFAKQALPDMQAMIQDARFGANMGRDFRGDFWNPDRMSSKEGLSMPEIRAIMGASGIGFRNFKGPLDTGMQTMAESSMALGLDPAALGGFMGASVRSGGMGSSTSDIYLLLTRIAGATEKGAEAGVSASEVLGTIASMNQKSQAEAGFLSPEMMRMNFAQESVMNASPDKAMQGQQGMGLRDLMAGTHGEGAAGVRQIGQMVDEQGNLKDEFQRMIDGSPELQKATEGDPGWLKARKLLGMTSVSAGVNQRILKGMGGTGLNRALAASMMGVDAMHLKGALAVGEFTGSEDMLSAGALSGDAMHGQAGQEEAQDLGRRAMRTMADANREIRATGGSPELYQEQIRFHNNMETFGNTVIQKLDGLTAAVMGGNRGH